MVSSVSFTRVSLLAVLACTSIAAVGCVGPLSVPPSQTSSSAPTHPVHPSVSPSSLEPTVSPEQSSVPVTIPCRAVISAQVMYDFNPNFALLHSFVPDLGSFAAQALSEEGTVCRWVNETNSEYIDVSISHPSLADFESRLATASTGTPIDEVDGEAFFDVASDTGTLQAFVNAHWITVSSTYFWGVEDGRSLLDGVLAAVK